MSQCDYIQANKGHNSIHKLDNDILTFLMQKRFYVIYEKYFVLKEKVHKCMWFPFWLFLNKPPENFQNSASNRFIRKCSSTYITTVWRILTLSNPVEIFRFNINLCLLWCRVTSIKLLFGWPLHFIFMIPIHITLKISNSKGWSIKTWRSIFCFPHILSLEHPIFIIIESTRRTWKGCMRCTQGMQTFFRNEDLLSYQMQSCNYG